MTDRKKKGVGFLVSGGLSIAAGIVFFVASATPDWLGIVIQGIGLIAGLLGITVVYPDTEE